MDQNELISSAVELALSLLEKNGWFLPFCKAIDEPGQSIIYTPGDMPETMVYAPGDPLPPVDDDNPSAPCSDAEAYEGVLHNVKKDVACRGLKGAAFCFHILVQQPPSEENFPAIKVELHYKGLPAVIYYFPYKVEGNAAEVLEYHTKPAEANLFLQGTGCNRHS